MGRQSRLRREESERCQKAQEKVESHLAFTHFWPSFSFFGRTSLYHSSTSFQSFPFYSLNSPTLSKAQRTYEWSTSCSRGTFVGTNPLAWYQFCWSSMLLTSAKPL